MFDFASLRSTDTVKVPHGVPVPVEKTVHVPVYKQVPYPGKFE